jgi:hypothetical protein
MSKVFVEYTIIHEKRSNYLQYMHKLMEQTGLELLEGTDQSSLFVEIWSNCSYSDYESLKKARLEPEENSVWEPFANLIVGGLNKLHIWHFSKPTDLHII